MFVDFFFVVVASGDGQEGRWKVKYIWTNIAYYYHAVVATWGMLAYAFSIHICYIMKLRCGPEGTDLVVPVESQDWQIHMFKSIFFLKLGLATFMP